ncbi:IS1096 element passenger TnpR family protein [Actinomadura welshii]
MPGRGRTARASTGTPIPARASRRTRGGAVAVAHPCGRSDRLHLRLRRRLGARHCPGECLPPGTKGDGPVCTTGKGACSPEDCGGAWGYEGLKDTLADPAAGAMRTCSKGPA